MAWPRAAGLSWLLPLLLLLRFAEALGHCPARCQCDLLRLPRTIDCSGKGLKAFPGNVSGLVEHLDLSGNLLSELPTDINRLSELRRLDLARNKLSSLPANLRGLGNLRELDLSDNALRTADDLSGLRHLGRLKTLYLTNNPLIELDGLKNPNLQYLKANSCGIERLRNTSLLGLPSLIQLNLASNPLKEINDPFCMKLEVLDLSKCHLKVLNPHSFLGFPELIELRLSDNPTLVYSTRYETLRHQKLQKIDVSRCDLDRPGLHGLPSLTYAKLSGNSIRMLPDRIFSKNRELAHLFLDYNHLEYLNKSAFANLLGLQVLDLSANGLKSVPPLAFRENVVLQFLNLSENYLADFPKLLASVVSLDLSSNLISKIDVDSLDGMAKLRYLDTSDNLFDELPKNVMSESLKGWSLKRNYIWTVDNASLAGLPALEKFDLSGNLLARGVTPSLFESNSNLHGLYLQDNPWACECKPLQALYRFLQALAPDTDLLVCQSPSNVTGYSWQLACDKEWTRESIILAQSKKTYGLILVGLLTLVVCSGMVISIRHTMKLKREARNHRIEAERAEVRERLRLLQRRNQRLHEELREHISEPRIHPLELMGPPSYEEAVTMTRLARSLDGLDSVTETQGSAVMRVAGSSESLRAGKKRRPRRGARRLRSQSEDNLARREMRREERLRRARESIAEDGSVAENGAESRGRPRAPTPTAARRRSKRMSLAKNGTSTDDEDSELEARAGRRASRNVARSAEREAKSGHRPSTDEES